MSLNDNKSSFYITGGVATGAVNDMELVWLKYNGATADSISDCWREYLTAQGFPYGTYNDSIKLWLERQGFTGGVKTMLNSFYTGTKERSFSNEFSSEFG